jgi:hypothetical protein
MGGFFKKGRHARLHVGLRQQRFVASDSVHNMKILAVENRVSGGSQSRAFSCGGFSKRGSSKPPLLRFQKLRPWPQSTEWLAKCQFCNRA